jgi:signal transduction histidine kinase
VPAVPRCRGVRGVRGVRGGVRGVPGYAAGWAAGWLSRARQRAYLGAMNDERMAEIVELVRRVRHDANNPLTAALGHVQLLLEDPAVHDAEVRSSLQVVERELHRLIEIIRRLGQVRLEP